jgi:8-oxo-dGTP pyrophosphatase MutT (NUDIX family)
MPQGDFAPSMAYARHSTPRRVSSRAVSGHARNILNRSKTRIFPLAMSAPIYVLGFPFAEESTRKVVLIRKARPSAHKGRLGAMGTVMRVGEMPVAAMVREFEQRTGYAQPLHWRRFGRLRGFGYDVHLFTTSLPTGARQEILLVAPIRPEPLIFKEIEPFNPGEPFLGSLSWLIPMAADATVADARIENFHH